MVTVADVLSVQVNVNTGNSAASVNAVSNQLQGIGASGATAGQATSALNGLFSEHSQSALRLAGALIGVNVGLSVFTAIGRQVHEAISDVIDTNIKFGSTMATVAAISGATSAQLAALSVAARTSGTDIGVGANAAAEALAELAKSGITTEQSLGGALRATELLATAGGVPLAQAADIAATALNTFGLSAAQLPHVVDLVAGAANASSIDVGDFQQSLSQAGAVAKVIGVSFDDTSVAIAELGQAGIRGSTAGSTFREFISRLQPTSKEAEAALRSLGLITADGQNKFFTAGGEVKKFSDVQQILKESLAGLTKQQQEHVLQTIFGERAVKGAATFAEDGALKFDQLAESINRVSASDVASKRLGSLGGDIEKLTAQAERLKLALGESLLGGGRPSAQAATGTVSTLADVTEDFGFGGALAFGLSKLDPFGGAGTGALFDAMANAAKQRRDALEAASHAPTGAQDEADAAASSIKALANQTSAAATVVDAALLPARQLRIELDALGQSGKGAAQGIGTLESATASLRLAGEGDLEAVASLRAEAALRLREQAVGERNQSSTFRQQLVVETTDAGISPEDRAKSQERLAFFDQELAAQLRLAQIEQQRAVADRAVKTEQDLQRQASLGLELQQLPLQDAALQNKIASLQLDQQAAPIRSQLLSIEEQITQSTDQRLGLERELAILKERQASTPARNALEDNQNQIRELQLELQTRDPSLDRGGIRRQIRDLTRAQPGLELDVARSDDTIRAVERQQAATKLADDITVNGLNQQKLAVQAQLTPLEQRKRLIDDASASVQRQLDIERAQFDQGQSGSKERLLGAQQITGALGLSSDEQQAVIAQLGLPQAAQGPQPIAGQAQGNVQSISVTIQNMGDNVVRSDADITAIQAAQQQAVIDAIASVLDKAASDATPPASTNLNGARRPMGQPQG